MTVFDWMVSLMVNAHSFATVRVALLTAYGTDAQIRAREEHEHAAESILRMSSAADALFKEVVTPADPPKENPVEDADGVFDSFKRLIHRL